MHLQEGVLDEITPGTVLTEEAQMQMETGSHRRSSDAQLLGCVARSPAPGPPEHPAGGARASRSAEEPDIIDYASVEFEVERMRKRLAVWEIFMTYMRDGAKTWSQVQQSLTQEDFDKIVGICDGVPLRDLMLDLR